MRYIQLLALIATGWTQAHVGTWKLNPARSVFPTPTQPKSLTVRVEPHPKGEVVTVDRTESNGQLTSSSTVVYLDGAARDFEGVGCSGSQTSRRLDDQSVEILRRCTSGDWQRLVRRLAPQGKEMLVEITKQQSGRHFEQRLVLEKQ
jgi:hypothetical protein